MYDEQDIKPSRSFDDIDREIRGQQSPSTLKPPKPAKSFDDIDREVRGQDYSPALKPLSPKKEAVRRSVIDLQRDVTKPQNQVAPNQTLNLVTGEKPTTGSQFTPPVSLDFRGPTEGEKMANRALGAPPAPSLKPKPMRTAMPLAPRPSTLERVQNQQAAERRQPETVETDPAKLEAIRQNTAESLAYRQQRQAEETANRNRTLRQIGGALNPAVGLGNTLNDAGVPDVNRVLQSSGKGVGSMLRGAAEASTMYPGAEGMYKFVTGNSLRDTANQYGQQAERLTNQASEALLPEQAQDQSFRAKLERGAGSILPPVGAALATGGGSAVSAGLGALTNLGQVASERDASGVPVSDTRRALSNTLAVATGMTEALGIGRMLDRVGLKTPLVHRVAQMVEEGGQEYAQDYLNDINAKLVAAYDPQRQINDPLAAKRLESAAIGAILGGAGEVADVGAQRIQQQVQDRAAVRNVANERPSVPTDIRPTMTGPTQITPITAPEAKPVTPKENAQITPTPEAAPVALPVPSDAAPAFPRLPEPEGFNARRAKLLGMDMPAEVGINERVQAANQLLASTNAGDQRQGQKMLRQALSDLRKSEGYLAEATAPEDAPKPFTAVRDAIEAKLKPAPKVTGDQPAKPVSAEESTTKPLAPASINSATGALRAEADAAKIKAAEFEQSGDFTNAAQTYDTTHKNLKLLRRKLGIPKTAEDVARINQIDREISAAASNRQRATAQARQMTRQANAPTADLAKPATFSPPKSAQVQSAQPDARNISGDISAPLLRLEAVQNPEGGIPSVEKSVKGLRRNYRAGMNNGQIEFASDVHRDLYDLAAKRKYARSGGQNKTYNRPVGDIDGLRQSLVSRTGLTEQEIDNLASDTYDSVRAQMKGVQDGELRKVSAVEIPNAPKPVNTAPLLRPDPAKTVNPIAEPIQPPISEEKTRFASELPEQRTGSTVDFTPKPSNRKRGGMDTENLTIGGMLKRRFPEGIRLADKGEARNLGGREGNALVGLVNKNSRVGVDDVAYALHEEGLRLPDGRPFVEDGRVTATEADVLDFLKSNGKQKVGGTRSLEQKLATEEAEYNEQQQPSKSLDEIAADVDSETGADPNTLLSAFQKLNTDDPAAISQMVRDSDKRFKKSATEAERAASAKAWERISQLTDAEQNALAAILPERVFAPVKDEYQGEGNYSRAVSDFGKDESLGAQGEANFDEVMNFFDTLAPSDREIKPEDIQAVREGIRQASWAKETAQDHPKDIPVLIAIAAKTDGESVRWTQLYDKLEAGEKLNATELGTFTQLGRKLGLSAKFIRGLAANNKRSAARSQTENEVSTQSSQAAPSQSAGSEAGRSAQDANRARPANPEAKIAEIDHMLSWGLISPAEAKRQKALLEAQPKARVAEQRSGEIPPMPERYTGRELAANAQVEYKQLGRRPKQLFFNDWGGELMRRSFSDVFDHYTEGNLVAGVEEARLIEEHIREASKADIYAADQQASLRQIADTIAEAIQDASSKGMDVAFISERPNQTREQARSQVDVSSLHEAFHLYQNQAVYDAVDLTDEAWLDRQPFGSDIHFALSTVGYPRDIHAFEAAAFVASGDYPKFGMSLNDAKQFLNGYFKAIVRKHGRAALDKFAEIDAQLQDTLEGVKNENGQSTQAEIDTSPERATANARRGDSARDDATRRRGPTFAESRSGRESVSGRGRAGIKQVPGKRFSFGSLPSEPQGQLAASGLGGLQDLFSRKPKPKGAQPVPVPKNFNLEKWAQKSFTSAMANALSSKDRAYYNSLPTERQRQAFLLSANIDPNIEAKVFKLIDQAADAMEKGDGNGVANARTEIKKLLSEQISPSARDVKWYDHFQSRLSNVNFKGTYERIAGEQGKEISEIFRNAQVDAANGKITRGDAVARLEKELKPYVRRLKAADKPGLARWIENHIDAVSDPDQSFRGLAGFLKGFQYNTKLRLNPRSALINSLQPLQTLWPHLTTREWAKLQYEAAKPSTWRRVAEAAARESGGSVENVNDQKKLLGWADLFTPVSEYNRIVGHLAGELFADRNGLTGDAKARMAADWAKKVEFDNSAYDIPPLFSGKIAGVVGQFKPFMVKNLERLYSDWKSAPPEALATNSWKGAGTIARRAKMITAQVAIGGVRSAVPGLKTIGGVLVLGGLAKAFSSVGMDDDKAEKLAEAVYFGAPALVEQDLSGSVAVFDEPFGKTAYEKLVNFAGGPTLSLIAKAYEEGGNIYNAEDSKKQTKEEKQKAGAIKLAKAITPYTKTAIAIAAAAQGKTPEMWLGKETEMTNPEAIGYGLMGTPLRQSKYYEQKEAFDWQKKLMPERFLQDEAKSKPRVTADGKIEAPLPKIKKGEPEAVFNQRKARVEGWMDEYGQKLLDSPRYKAMTADEQKAAMQLLRARIGRQQNLKQPKPNSFEPNAVLLGVKKSAATKARRQSKYLYQP